MRVSWYLALAAWLACGPAAFAEAKWIRMQAPGFDVVSSAGERATRETLQYFEQVRSFFSQSVPGVENSGVAPVRIVAFGSQKDYAPYRLKSFAAAYYTQAAGYDYIVMGQTGVETFPIATHEYVHLIARHAGLKLPIWLNEGLAELYSTLVPRGPNILVGSLIPARQRALLAEPWAPLQAILDAGPDSPYYNEKNKAGSLYNVGWALTHMLMLGDGYSPQFAKFLLTLQDGTPSGDAFFKIYGKTVPQIDKELHSYISGFRFKGALIEAKLEKNREELRGTPADPFDVKLRLAELRNFKGNERETKQTLEELTREAPQQPEAYVELGYIAWRSGRRDEAQHDFAAALSNGETRGRVLWDYGRMLEQIDRAQSIQVLTRLVKQEPDRLDARLELARLQLAAKQPELALVTLLPIHKISQADAPRLFLIMAYAQLQNGNRKEARGAAERLIKTAQTSQDREAGQHLIDYLDRTSAQPAPAPEPGTLESTTPKDAGPPTLRHMPAGGFRAATRPSITGTFARLDCAGVQARAIIHTEAGDKVFLIEDPTKIVVSGASGGTVDLTCGAQKPIQVQIEYDPPMPGKAGIDGLVRAIRFQP